MLGKAPFNESGLDLTLYMHQRFTMEIISNIQKDTVAFFVVTEGECWGYTHRDTKAIYIEGGGGGYTPARA